MAENALAGRAEEMRKGTQAAGSVEAARAALAENRYEDAVRHADEALAVDAGKTDAQDIKTQATARIAEARAAEAEAARKKRTEEKKVASARRQPTAAAQARAEHTVAAPAAPTEGVAAGPATLRLVFESPISEGSVMVYVNDEKALQKAFDFSKKAGLFKRVDGTGTVEAPIPVKAGPVTVKVWLSGKGLSAAAFTTVAGQLAGGETRTLKLDYSGKQLTAHIQ